MKVDEIELQGSCWIVGQSLLLDDNVTFYAFYDVQLGASDHSQGFEDKNLGSSPSLLGQ